MYSNEFEGAFSDFLDSAEYDKIEEAVFQIARTAFIAGYRAGGGDPDAMGGKIVEIVRNKD